jgi:ABC-type transport system involved in multi-copper enzyme maturation permease subunit
MINILRVFTIATNVFWEVIRDRVLYLIGLFTIVMLASVRFIPELAASTEQKIILDIGIAAIGFLGLIITIFIGPGLVNKEIEKRTVYVLVAKPISRSELILGKHIGLSVVLAVLLASMTVIYMLILSFNKIPYPPLSLGIASLFIWIQLSLLTAVGILFGVFTSSILATILTLSIYLMGLASRDLVTLGKLTKNPVIEQLMMNLYLVLPDLQRLNLINEAVYGQIPPLPTLITNGSYALIYIILLLSLSTLIFSRREF